MVECIAAHVDKLVGTAMLLQIYNMICSTALRAVLLHMSSAVIKGETRQ